MNINAYNSATSLGRTNQAKARSGQDFLNANKSELTMQDFLNLLTAQLANQDSMNPMDDTQFISQMAEFSSLQAMQQINELSTAQYGASMVGKNVLVAEFDKKGQYVETKGVVDSVKFAEGNCILTVKGKEYPISSVMEVLNKIEEEPVDPPTT